MTQDSLGDTARHEYRVKRWLQVLFGLSGVALVGLGIITCFRGVNQSNLFPELVMVVTGAYLLALAFRPRLVIEGTRLEQQGVFRNQSADLSEVEGFRTVSSRYGTYRQIYLKDGRGKITIANNFHTGDGFREWMQQVTDLDERDRVALLTEIEQSEALGATPEERMAALKRARRWNFALVGVCLAAAAGLNLAPKAWWPISALLLALSPVVLLFLLHQAPLLYAFAKPKKDPRTDLTFAFLIASFGLLFFCGKVNLVSIQPLLILMAALFLGAVVGFGSAIGGKSPGRWLAPALIFTAMYSYGAAVAADTVLDHAQPFVYSALVIGKHISSGRSTTYYLSLAPWGPINSPNQLSVDSTVYSMSQAGDHVCLALYPGALHAAWFQRVNCPEEDMPAGSFQP